MFRFAETPHHLFFTTLLEVNQPSPQPRPRWTPLAPQEPCEREAKGDDEAGDGDKQQQPTTSERRHTEVLAQKSEHGVDTSADKQRDSGGARGTPQGCAVPASQKLGVWVARFIWVSWVKFLFPSRSG